MRGRRSSAAETELEGWRERLPAPLEPSEREDETVTAVGSVSVARALLAIRGRQPATPDPYDDDPLEDSIDTPTPRQMSVSGERETVPAPAQSDVRELAGRSEERAANDEDPLERYVDSLLEPAIEVARRQSGTRVRRETVKMTMRPRAATLPMIERPVPATPDSSAAEASAEASTPKMPAAIATPPRALTPPRWIPMPAEQPKGNKRTLLVAFFIGIVLALIVGGLVAFGPLHTLIAR